MEPAMQELPADHAETVGKSTAKLHVIEREHLDPVKFYPLAALSGFSIRALLYPLSLIKTRLMMQKLQSNYNGTFHAATSIYKNEGFKGLYRGFWISALQVAPQLFYISTYEAVRESLKLHTPLQDGRMRSLLAGFCASCVGQTMVVPIDVVSQHLQMIGQHKSSTSAPVTSASRVSPAADCKQRRSFSTSQTLSKPRPNLPSLELPESVYRARGLGASKELVSCIYHQHGLRGFYRGYLASLAVYAPNSGLWWFFYSTYFQFASSFIPCSHLLLQSICAPMAGVCAVLITNPLDLLRTRIQVQGGGFLFNARRLWAEEGASFMYKGLSARMAQTCGFSFFIIVGYESVKRLSLKPEYQHQAQW